MDVHYMEIKVKKNETYDIDQLDKDVSVVVVSVGDISYLQIHVAALYIRYQNCMFLSTNRIRANYLPSGTVLLLVQL